MPDVPGPIEVPSAPDVIMRVLALAELQSAALAASDWDRFDAILDDREALLASPGLGAALAATPAEARALVSAALARIEALDAQHQALLAREQLTVREALPGLNAGRRAAAAYRGAPITTAYVDSAS